MISLLATLTIAFRVIAFTSESESVVPDITGNETVLRVVFSSKDNCSEDTQVGSLSIDVSNWTDATCDTTCRDLGISDDEHRAGVRSFRVAKPLNSSHEYDCSVWNGDCFKDRPLHTVTSKPGECLKLDSELTNDTRIMCTLNGRSNSVVCPRNFQR